VIGRVLRILFGTAALAFLAWNMSDGMISFRRLEIHRADNPTGFWLLGALLASLAIGFICVGIFVKGDKSDG
jgi:hypothetical protein